MEILVCRGVLLPPPPPLDGSDSSHSSEPSGVPTPGSSRWLMLLRLLMWRIIFKTPFLSIFTMFDPLLSRTVRLMVYATMSISTLFVCTFFYAWRTGSSPGDAQNNNETSGIPATAEALLVNFAELVVVAGIVCLALLPLRRIAAVLQKWMSVSELAWRFPRITSEIKRRRAIEQLADKMAQTDFLEHRIVALESGATVPEGPEAAARECRNADARKQNMLTLVIVAGAALLLGIAKGAANAMADMMAEFIGLDKVCRAGETEEADAEEGDVEDAERIVDDIFLYVSLILINIFSRSTTVTSSSMTTSEDFRRQRTEALRSGRCRWLFAACRLSRAAAFAMIASIAAATISIIYVLSFAATLTEQASTEYINTWLLSEALTLVFFLLSEPIRVIWALITSPSIAPRCLRWLASTRQQREQTLSSRLKTDAFLSATGRACGLSNELANLVLCEPEELVAALWSPAASVPEDSRRNLIRRYYSLQRAARYEQLIAARRRPGSDPGSDADAGSMSTVVALSSGGDPVNMSAALPSGGNSVPPTGAALSQRLEAAERELDAARVRIEEMTEELESQRKASDVVLQLQDSIAQAHVQIAELRAGAADLTAARDSAEGRATAAEARADASEKRIASLEATLREESTRAAEAASSAQASAVSLNATLEKSLAETAALQSELTALRDVVAQRAPPPPASPPPSGSSGLGAVRNILSPGARGRPGRGRI